MKKLKPLLLTLVLSTLLTGNLLANGAGYQGGAAVQGLLEYAFGQALMLLRGDSCPLRQCTNCRPNDEMDDNGNCRPRED
ncbi:MAG: hypothetical protein ACRD6X_07820 [Pyrinomonadaceae bacterium]